MGLRHALAFTIASALALAGCSGVPARAPRQASHALRVAATKFPASAPIYIAAAKGYFADEGLDVDLHTYDAGKLSLEAVLADETDIAAVAETPIARAVLDNKSVAVIATLADVDSANWIVARRDKGISSARDLVGKRIGLVSGSTGDFFLHIYLTVSRVDPDLVQVVPMSPNHLIDSLASGDVVAISGWAPYTTGAKQRLGKNAVLLDEPGLYTMSWNAVVRPEFARSRSADIERFLRATRRANAFIAENPAEAIRITERACGVPAAELRRSWGNYHWGTKLDQTLVLSLEDESQWMISEAGTKTQIPDFLDYIYTTPLRHVSPSDVTVVEPEEP